MYLITAVAEKLEITCICLAFLKNIPLIQRVGGLKPQNQKLTLVFF